MKNEKISMENLKLLANAIIIQAYKDYKDEPAMRGDVINFIRSDWFIFLSRGYVKQADLIQYLRSEVYEYGEKKLLNQAQL